MKLTAMMKKILGALTGLALVGAVPAAHAAPLVLNFGTEFSGTGAVLSGPVVVTIDDGGGSGVVDITVDTSGLVGSPTGYEFVTGLYLNLNPAINPATLAVSLPGNNIDPRVFNIGAATDTFQAAIHGLSDILIAWTTSDAIGLFRAGEADVIRFTGAGLTAADFDFLSTPLNGNAPFKAALRVRKDAQVADFGWFAPAEGQGVPEPGVMLLFGFGLLGLGVMRRRGA